MADEATRYQLDVPAPTPVLDPEAYPRRVVKNYPAAPRHSLPWPPEKAGHRLGRLLAELGGITRSQWMTPLDMLPFVGSFELIPDEDPLLWLVTRRPTPSGGARYSAEWYVVAGPDSEVPAGVYYYDPARHELRRLRSGDHRYWVTTGPATTVLVQTSVFWRLAAKYGEMFYRLACLETGIQAAQALVVGGDLGARARLCFRDADVTGLLGLDPRAEGVHSVIELREPAPAAYDGPSLAAFPQAVGVHLAVVEESRRHPEPLPAPAPGTGRRIVLPPAEPDMLSGLRTRHATLRGFSGEPMSVTDLSAVLAAYGQQPRWDLPAHLVEFYCLVNDVTDVPAGAYRYLPDQHQLELVREEDPRPRLRKAGLAALPQQGARTANFWLMPVGDAEPAERRYGNRWYRVQHAAAGAALHRACLAAAGIGVASRIQNDVLIHQLDEWLGLAGRRRGLLVAQLGWEHRGGLRPEFRLNW